ncbi:MAG: hypothetical protein JSV65_04230 [Armatimonadota bacterium]|nr:MAG: hypothetical protein JSV65_04230 [Armatimonadota bacterium]
MYVLSILLPALGIGVIILMLVEAREWQARRTVISRRQVGLRMLGGLLLLCLITAIFLGLFILGLRSPTGRPVLFLAWWLGCLAIAVILMFLALADLRHVENRRRDREHEIWRDFARVLAERIRRDRGEDGPDIPDADD